MSILSITADLPNIDNVLKAVERAGRGNLPYTQEAVRAALTDVVQRTWIAYASGVVVTYSGGTFRIHVLSGEYVRSIQEGFRMLDDLTGEIINTSGHGSLIEDGVTPFDMKEGLLTSPKSKWGKDGSLYITVPFRHGTPGAKTMPSMPKSVYKDAKQLGYSRRNGSLNALASGQQYTYNWGGRLKQSSEGQRSHASNHPGAGYTWKTGLYSGMVRMGQEKHSQYITFRRVSTNSDPNSWQHPGVKPRPIREAVIENTREEVLQLIRNGFEMDLYFMGLGGEK